MLRYGAVAIRSKSNKADNIDYEEEYHMKRICIRVDGNEIIATGHVMRCLSIAEQLRKLGAEVIFLVADERPCALIKAKGFRVDVLHTIWDNLSSETEMLCDYIKKQEVEVLLLDTYYVTVEYLQNLSQYTKIVYIDDLAKFLYPVQALVHYWAFADVDQYAKPYRLAGRNVDFLIGGEYVPLREEFAYQPYEVRPEVQNVLVTTGGTDRLNVAGNLLDCIVKNQQLSRLEYHVIVGCFNQNKNGLYQMAERYSNIHLHENVNNMAEWMRKCDVAVSAAGTTIYELCACGIPSVCLEIAQNQEGAVTWEREGYMFYAGNAYKDMNQCMEICVESLLKLQNSYKIRKEKSRRMQSLVDGNGARRIAEYIDGII